MRFPKSKSLLIAASAVAIAAGAGGVAIADQASDPVTSEFSTLRKVHDVSPQAKKVQDAVAFAAAGLPDDAAPTKIDWSRATSVPIQDGYGEAWLAPAGDKLCTIVPVPGTNGYGVACNTPEEIAAGDAYVVVSPPAGSSATRVVIAVPRIDGADQPAVAGSGTADGAIDGSANLAAASLPAKGTVQIGNDKVSLATYGAPPEAKFVPAK